jgi:hypothetical protein
MTDGSFRTTQFATIDAPFLGWDFDLRDEQGLAIGNVSRNFVGFAREVSRTHRGLTGFSLGGFWCVDLY